MATPARDDSRPSWAVSCANGPGSKQDSNVSLTALAPGHDILKGPLTWNSVSLGSPRSYTIQLSVLDLQEMDAALVSFKKLEIDGHKVCEANFPLPNLGSRLKLGASGLYSGPGFLLVHGIHPGRYSNADSVITYLGIASYIGEKRGVQNKKGDVLTHVTDSKLWTVSREKRHGIHANKELPFHNDMGADILALQARQSAAYGGATYLASARAIYNDLLAEHPKELDTLFSPTWPIQTSGKSSRFFLSPLMTFSNGNLMVAMDPGRLGPHPTTRSKPNKVPELSRNQQEALSVFLDLARRNQVRVPIQSGDMLFVNNWAILHRRERYEDDEATSRHLIRLWLRSSSLGWEVPSSMAKPWLSAFGGGVNADQVYAIEPMPEYKMPRYSAGSAAFVIESEDESSGDY